MGRPKKPALQEPSQPQPSPSNPTPPPAPVQEQEPEAMEVKAYVPRPELVAAGLEVQRIQEIRHKEATLRNRGRTQTDLGLECIACGSLFVGTSDTRRKLGMVRRRRVCQKCGFAWFTQERPEREIEELEKGKADA
jgi:hypothetical protein